MHNPLLSISLQTTKTIQLCPENQNDSIIQIKSFSTSSIEELDDGSMKRKKESWKRAGIENSLNTEIVYNFCRESKKIIRNELMEGFFCSDFLEVGLDLENSQTDLIVPEEKVLIEDVAVGWGRVTVRGKGRPKGEKNSKNTEKNIKRHQNEEICRRGHWSFEENKKYHWFLEIYSSHFICKEMRRLDKIFKTMATFIESREAEQCRSHHQKMEKKYHSFPNIILYLRNLHYGNEDTHLLEEDLRANSIQTVCLLIDAKELKNLQKEKNEPPTPSFCEESKLNNVLMHSPLKDQLFPNTFMDIMGEDYECRFDLDDLLL